MLETRYHSKSQGTWEQCEWLGNPDVDKAIEDALATVDQQERFAKYMKIQDQIVELAPTIWLADQAQEFAYETYITWPVVEDVKAGKTVSPVMGYSHWLHDIKVFPDQRAALLK
jgi:peptide/nickel transport system substrate-binding protein